MGKVETRTDTGNKLNEVKNSPFSTNPAIENQIQTQASDGKEA